MHAYMAESRACGSRPENRERHSIYTPCCIVYVWQCLPSSLHTHFIKPSHLPLLRSPPLHASSLHWEGCVDLLGWEPSDLLPAQRPHLLFFSIFDCLILYWILQESYIKHSFYRNKFAYRLQYFSFWYSLDTHLHKRRERTKQIFCFNSQQCIITTIVYDLVSFILSIVFFFYCAYAII